MKVVFREEYKYLISYLDYLKIKDSLKLLLVHDQHGKDDSYPVNSIYFDDIYYSGAQDKAFGNQLHRKFRIRYYSDFNRKKLELKEKTGVISSKISTPLTDELYNAILTNDMDVLEKYFDNRLIRLFALETYKKNLEPKLNIFYHREAYKDELDNLRITFDHSLSTSLYDQDITGVDIKLLNDTTLIMEVKYEHFIPKEIKKILHSISTNQLAVSKYFLGYNQLDL